MAAFICVLVVIGIVGFLFYLFYYAPKIEARKRRAADANELTRFERGRLYEEQQRIERGRAHRREQFDHYKRRMRDIIDGDDKTP